VSLNKDEIIKKKREKMNEKQKSVIEKAVNQMKKDPFVIGIILHGSFARATEHNFSDIDLYLVRKAREEDSYDDKTIFYYLDEIPVQIISRSEKSFKTKFLKRTRNKPIALYGKILYDSEGLLDEYFQKAKRIAEQGPLPLTAEEKLSIKIILSTDILTVRGLIDKRRFISASQLIDDILYEAVSGYYDINRWWFPSKKNLFEDLKEKDCRFGEIYEKIILENDTQKKLYLLEIVANNVLEKLGGKIYSYEMRY
jgi:predicted nucleotidyltransferase